MTGIIISLYNEILSGIVLKLAKIAMGFLLLLLLLYLHLFLYQQLTLLLPLIYC